MDDADKDGWIFFRKAGGDEYPISSKPAISELVRVVTSVAKSSSSK